MGYHNNPKVLDRQVWTNSVDPEKTQSEVWSGSTLFAIQSASFGRITLWEPPCSNLWLITAAFCVSDF